MFTKTKYYHANGKVWTIYFDSDTGLWTDIFGCIYALRRDEGAVDSIDRCGLGPASLPEGHPANDACLPHDYKYESPAYQLFHNRSEADADLKRDLGTMGYPFLGWLFYPFVRIFGGLTGKLQLWENDETRDK